MSRTNPPGRWLLLTASMGSGHNHVAGELARRIEALGGAALVRDILEMLPAGVGPALRSGYATMLRRAPVLYEWIFNAFFLERRGPSPGVFPLDALAAPALRAVVREYRPDAVLCTFHLAGQVAGGLRRRGRLAVPVVVAITEPAAHRQWLHPGADLFLCPYPWVADEVGRRTGIPAITPGPVVAERFQHWVDPARARAMLGLTRDEHAVLVSTGSWGIGDAVRTASLLATLPGIRPIVLCGRNARLRREVTRLPGCTALGWRGDMPELYAASAALVDASGGSACAEAFAAGLPVVLYQPLPGHGRLGAGALAAHGVATLVEDPMALTERIRSLVAAGPARDAQVARASAVFTADPVAALLAWRATGATGYRRPDHRVTNVARPGDRSRPGRAR